MARARGSWATPLHTTRQRRVRHAAAVQTGRRSLLSDRRRLLRVGTIAVGVYLVGMAIALVFARSALYGGVDAIHRAQNDISQRALLRRPSPAITQAGKDIAAANGDFGRADALLMPFRPLLGHLGWLPGVGGRLEAVPAVARLAHQTTSGTLLLLQGLQPVVDLAERGGAAEVSPRAVLGQVAAQQPEFAQACGSLESAQATRRGLSGAETAGIASQLQSLDRQLPRLTAACHALVLLPELLGWEHPATYMIGYLNPDELRATGGYLGSMSLVTIRDGRPAQKFAGTWLEDTLAYAPPEALARFEGEPGWLLRDSNWSPNFPSSAALERFFARLNLSWDAPTVINLTPQVTADALRALGGFYSKGYHRWIDAQNVIRLTDFYTHHSVSYGPLQNLSPDTARKQFIQIVANHIFSRLNSLSVRDVVRLAQTMGDAVTHHDIQMNSTDQPLQSLIDEVGASGRVNQTPGDSLYIVDSNLSYNKVNPYIHLNADYRATILANRWVQADLTLRYTNVPAPADVYVNSFGPKAGRWGKPWDYGDYVRVYVPAGAALLQQSGWQPLSPGPAYGKTMLSGYFIVRKGQFHAIHLRYLVPPNVFDWSNGSRYRLTVQHQAGIVPDRVSVTVTTIAGPTFHTVLRRPQTDWTTSIGIPQVPYQPIALPAGPPSDPTPGHWIEAHTYFAPPTPEGGVSPRNSALGQ